MWSMAVAQALPSGGNRCPEQVRRVTLKALRSAVILLPLPVLSGRGRCRAQVYPRAERPVLGGRVPAVCRWSSAARCGSRFGVDQGCDGRVAAQPVQAAAAQRADAAGRGRRGWRAGGRKRAHFAPGGGSWPPGRTAGSRRLPRCSARCSQRCWLASWASVAPGRLAVLHGILGTAGLLRW
jgi:hypothetical protein